MNGIILNINEKEFAAEFDVDDYSLVNINGVPYQVELLKKYSQNVFSFAVNRQLCQVQLDFDENGSLILAHNGFIYEIEITDETRKLLKKFIAESGVLSGPGAGTITAPMPGLVVKNLVKEGDFVNKNDGVIIVEAMKMENVLKSPVSGKVAAVKAGEGENVNKDAVLVEITPEEE